MNALIPNEVSRSRDQTNGGRSGWRRVKFGDVVQCVSDAEANPQAAGIERVVGLEHLDRGSLHINRWASIEDGTTFTRRFRSGQVLFGKRRAYQRKLAVADFDGICSGDILVFQPRDDGVIPELLPFIIRAESFWQHALDTSAGSLSPRTKWQDLARYEFALPPKKEQCRIAGILWAADEQVCKVREVEGALVTLDRVKAEYLFTHGTEGVAVHETKIGLLPRNWRLSSVGESCSIMNQQRFPINAETRAKMKGPYPYYGPTGVLDSINEHRFEGCYALIGEDGDHFLKFRDWSMTQLVEGKFNVNNHAHAVQGKADCTTEWFYHYYRHRDVRPFLSRQGAGRLKLNKATLERLPLPIPPIAQQKAICRILDAFDTVQDKLRISLQFNRKLVKSLSSHLLGSNAEQPRA